MRIKYALINNIIILLPRQNVWIFQVKTRQAYVNILNKQIWYLKMNGVHYFQLPIFSLISNEIIVKKATTKWLPLFVNTFLERRNYEERLDGQAGTNKVIGPIWQPSDSSVLVWDHSQGWLKRSVTKELNCLETPEMPLAWFVWICSSETRDTLLLRPEAHFQRAPETLTSQPTLKTWNEMVSCPDQTYRNKENVNTET